MAGINVSRQMYWRFPQPPLDVATVQGIPLMHFLCSPPLRQFSIQINFFPSHAESLLMGGKPSGVPPEGINTHYKFKCSLRSPKSAPLVHVTMTRQKEAEYVAFLESVKSNLHAPTIKQFTSDYEKALWKAVEIVFPSDQAYYTGAAHTTKSMRLWEDWRINSIWQTEYQTDLEIRRVVQQTVFATYTTPKFGKYI